MKHKYIAEGGGGNILLEKIRLLNKFERHTHTSLVIRVMRSVSGLAKGP